MKGQWTIKKQLIALSATMLSIQLIIAFVGYQSLTSVKSHLYTVFSKRLPSINSLVQADRDFQQMLVAERTLLLEGLSDKQRKALADDYFTNKQQVVDRFKKYTVLGDSPKEIEISKKFNEGLEAFEKTAADKFPLDKEGNIRKFSKAELITNSLGPVNSKFEGARDSLDQLQELILGMGDEEFKEADETYSNSIFLMSIISIVSLFGSVGICIFMARRIDGRINNIVESISNEGQNLENVSNTFKNKSVALSSISEQLSAAATETSSSLHEISQMIKSNTDGSNNVASLIQKSQELVTDGVKSLGDLGRGVKDVENSTTTLANTVEKSNSELNEIVKVFEEINVKTQVINDIVFQTKLLSFNASVEAARAGENGKGFSVVAEEVGNLAKMSGESADEISKLLVDSLKKVTDIVDVSSRDVNESLNLSRDKINKSVEISNQCQEVFTQVLRNFDEVSANSNEVANASKEQLIGVEEVSKAMQEISSSASLTSQSAHDLNTASSELSQAVNHIGEDITDLKGLIIAQIKSARHAVSNVVNFNKTKRNAETKKAA
ncbi:methyl-accepting chemotaxis protein [Bacteriovorax sp. BAL6_X]|uniref:HAMP domain-containing methyl-accepting chemotaxis protein n=1 Tax=Bacteriovorax sp. BAL6_X TaxID=1201290 RepID=UPI0003F804F4|nr:methyl-accepting chemotaxis protein [Bacteriovorax sp. BAL6_X]